ALRSRPGHDPAGASAQARGVVRGLGAACRRALTAVIRVEAVLAAIGRAGRCCPGVIPLSRIWQHRTRLTPHSVGPNLFVSHDFAIPFQHPKPASASPSLLWGRSRLRHTSSALADRPLLHPRVTSERWFMNNPG